MLRSRKTGSLTMINYLSSSFMYTKIANLILWFYADIRYGLPFGAIIILAALIIPEPAYRGKECVTYFRGPDSLDEELKQRGVTWLVCLYAVWPPACVNFAPVFAELSASYALDNFKFGKLDVGRYPGSAQKFRVQDGPTSRQLPTLLLFTDGKLQIQRPDADHTGKLKTFLFSKDNVKATYDLDGIYQQCKEKLATAKSAKNAKGAKKDE